MADGMASAGTVVLDWHAHPYCPVSLNARRALRLLRSAGRAVWLAREGRQRGCRHALFPTDLSPSSLASLRQAVRMLPRMRFTVLHGCRVSGEGSMRAAGVGDAVLDACRRRTEGAARAAGYRFAAQLPGAARRLTVRVLLLREPWAVAVAAHAAMIHADLLVLADARGGWWEDRRRHADLCMLLRRTDCDLLLLPRADAA